MAPRRLNRSLLAFSLLVGCASAGPGPTDRLRDGGMEAVDADRPSGGCEPPCSADEVCREGICVAPAVDGDGDGVPVTTDCDDTDPSVGNRSSRTCSSPCATGTELCMDAVWGECSAPTECECPEGASPRTLDCGRCGAQRQVCLDGRWVDDGVCMGEGVCAPGEAEEGAACGCGVERRVCGLDCSWGAFECSGGSGDECEPGDTDTETRACGNCDSGTQTRTRTCVDCRWGAWSAFGSCAGSTGCAPGETRGGCDLDSEGDPTACGVQVCTASCAWGGCQPAATAQCLSSGGTNYQCCTAPGGVSGWQFCSASTCQWFPCAANSC